MWIISMKFDLCNKYVSIKSLNLVCFLPQTKGENINLHLICQHEGQARAQSWWLHKETVYLFLNSTLVQRSQSENHLIIKTEQFQ